MIQCKICWNKNPLHNSGKGKKVEHTHQESKFIKNDTQIRTRKWKKKYNLFFFLIALAKVL